MQDKTCISRTKLLMGLFLQPVILLFIPLLVLVGCGMYNTDAPPEKQKAAKEFTPEDNQAVIYVYRSRSLVAVIQAFRIYLDDQAQVDCTSGTFIRLVVKPGSHVIGVGHAGRWTPSEGRVMVETKKGGLYFVELTVGANPISGIPELSVVDAQKARSDIKPLDLLELGVK